MSLAQQIQAPAVEVETAADAAAVDALLLRAFGPGRFAKTAERVRETATRAVAFVTRHGGAVTGVVQLWNIRVGETPALFLGPIAVEAEAREAGLGGALVATCADWARAEGANGILLVGDPGYFERFGFVRAEGARLPGPVDPKRLLWLPLAAVRPEGVTRGA